MTNDKIDEFLKTYVDELSVEAVKPLKTWGSTEMELAAILCQLELMNSSFLAFNTLLSELVKRIPEPSEKGI